MSILVIEDDEELSAEIMDYLRRRGHAATPCRSLAAAQAALTEALAAGRPPRAVLCDLGLPDGNGLNLYLAFAARIPATRWILMSGDNDPAAVDRALVPGTSPPLLVDKPIRLRDLDRLLADPGSD